MFDIHDAGDGHLRMSGRLDAVESERLLEALRGVQQSLTVDCTGLDYISSAGIGVLIETYKRLNASGHTLRLVNLLPRVRSIFTYAGLDRILALE